MNRERKKMMSNKKQNISEQNNSVPKMIFPLTRKSRIFSSVLSLIIEIAAIYYGIVNSSSISEEILIDTINIGLTVVLAIVALAFTVFQSDKELSEKRNSDENIKKVYLSYVFGIFPIVLELILGYLVALIFKDIPQIISLYFVGTVVILTECITRTMASFVAFLNIRD